jgi:adenylate cyclase
MPRPGCQGRWSGVSENRTRGIQFGAPPAPSIPGGTGIEPPVPEWVDVSQTLDRWFAFVDVCGFTAFTERHGTPAALEVLTRFRSAVRAVTGRRGVRVLKWLGDGAMLVGVEPGPVIAAVCELALRFSDDDFDIHAGVAGGHVLLFEGDDYIGPAANHAARLCEIAGPGEILGLGVTPHLPEWVRVDADRSVQAQGVGELHGVCRLVAAETVMPRAACA